MDARHFMKNAVKVQKGDNMKDLTMDIGELLFGLWLLVVVAAWILAATLTPFAVCKFCWIYLIG